MASVLCTLGICDKSLASRSSVEEKEIIYQLRGRVVYDQSLKHLPHEESHLENEKMIKSLKFLSRELNDAESQSYLGVIYSDRLDDHEQGNFWYTKAAKQGHLGASLNYANLHYYQYIDNSNQKMAFKLLNKAVKNGLDDGLAFFILGNMYYKDRENVFTVDQEKACVFYKKAICVFYKYRKAYNNKSLFKDEISHAKKRLEKYKSKIAGKSSLTITKISKPRNMNKKR